MEAPFRLKLPATLGNLPAYLSVVRRCATSLGIDSKRILEIEIATEEALVNIIRYAYEKKDGDVELRCRKEGDKGFIIEIRDEGSPFNPISLTAPDVHAGILERKVGGLGILIMKRLADTVTYIRDSTSNVLTLRFDSDIHDSAD
jgi:serine/threonine-protein kinase RsbW